MKTQFLFFYVAAVLMQSPVMAQGRSKDGVIVRSCGQFYSTVGKGKIDTKHTSYFSDENAVAQDGNCQLPQELRIRGQAPQYLTTAMLAKISANPGNLKKLTAITAKLADHMLGIEGEFLMAELLRPSSHEAQFVRGCKKEQILLGDMIVNFDEFCERMNLK